MTYLYGKSKLIYNNTINTAIERIDKIHGNFTRAKYKEFLKCPTNFTESVRQTAYTLARYALTTKAVLMTNNLKGVKLSEIINETMLTSYNEVEVYHVQIACFMVSPQMHDYLFNFSNKIDSDFELPLVLIKEELPPRHEIMPESRYLCEQDDAHKEAHNFKADMPCLFHLSDAFGSSKNISNYGSSIGEIFDYARELSL